MAIQGASAAQAPGSTSAQVGQGGDLNDELYKAVEGSKTEFSGSFYHCSTESSAPNPGLEIEGLGIIGLPLSQRDATAIIARAAQAPFGKGTQTVVDTTVRDTWEIEPASVKFTNPKWTSFVHQVATKTVWTALGVAPFTTRPRCELYKLLLYQPGGHFLAHQDTLKSNGMFATIIIVLPSAFQGGEVHVSHAGQTKVLDISRNSDFSTSILAWYTDVMHEVKPVTSGYRLALSYNLIHTSPNMPQPSLPKHTMISTPLGQCLQKWKNGGFTTTPDPPFTAYLLDHQYSANDLDRGQEGLKGKDYQLMAQLLPLAESLRFVLGLANLTRTVTGSANDSGYDDRYNKRMRYGHGTYEAEKETHTFAEIEEDDYEIGNLVWIDEGECEEDLDFGDFKLDKKCLVPRNPFKGVAPDEEDCEGYMGNWAGTLEQWYRRSVLILFRNEDAIAVCISIHGIDWALDNLYAYSDPEEQENPTAKSIVSALLSRLERKHNPRRVYRSNEDIETDRQCAKNLLARAIEWKQEALWNRVVLHCGPALDIVNTSITEALEVFSLEAIKPGLLMLVRQSTSLQTRFAVIKAIAGKIGAAGSEWVRDLAKDALSSYTAAAVADIPTLVAIAQDRGPGVVESSVLPKIPKSGTYGFLLALAHALHEHRSKSDLNEEQDMAASSSLVRQCLLNAVPQRQVAAPSSGYSAAASAKIDRTAELADLCFQALGEPDLCVNVYNLVSKTASYSTLVDFAKTVHGHLSKLSSSAEDIVVNLNDVIHHSVQTAIPKWEVGLQLPAPSRPAPPTHSYYGRAPPAPAVPAPVDPRAPNVKSNRICELVDLCFTLGDLRSITTLLNSLLQLPVNVKLETRFKELYTPLMPQLKATLVKHGKSFAQEPFAFFFKHTISLYLAHILGPRTPKTLLPVLPTRNVGCTNPNCVECTQLRAFVNNSTPELKFRAVQRTRTHVENEITQARIEDIITTQTLTNEGTPYTLVVSKRPEVIALLAWKEVQGEAVLFLRSVADDGELKEVMGERYEQALWAIHGQQVFALVGNGIVPAVNVASASAGPSVATSPAPTVHTAPVVTGAGASSATPSTSAAGTKRKHREPPKNTIAVIDLT